jgi:hypothetical protein
MTRVVPVFAAALAAIAFATAAGAAADAKGPPCTNFIAGDAGYTTAGRVTADMTLAAPPCADATYLLDIYDFAGTTPLAENVAPSSVSGAIVSFDTTISNPPSDGVCLVVESYFRGRLVDRAPNTGCERIDPSGSGASGTFN